MFVNKDSIIANGISLGPYLLQAKYSYNKLWADDTGRNLAGSFSGTLVGIFPKFILTFRKLTKSELNIIAPILDSATQQFTYYDDTLNQTKTITTYTGDWEVTNKLIIDENNKNDSFDCSFIAVDRRR